MQRNCHSVATAQRSAKDMPKENCPPPSTTRLATTITPRALGQKGVENDILRPLTPEEIDARSFCEEVGERSPGCSWLHVVRRPKVLPLQRSPERK